MRISTSDLDRLLGAWRHRGSTLPAALAEGLTALVLDGRLPIGTQLPAERALASAVGVSRVTVSAVDGTRFAEGNSNVGNVLAAEARQRTARPEGVPAGA